MTHTTLDQMRALKHVMFVDDERELGNSIIITLANGWFFADDPDCGVQGFDTVSDARRGCARKRVVYDPERYAALNPEQAQAEQHDAPQGWAPCSPDLLKSGVCCESAPRIAGRPGSGVSHYHPAPQQESQVRPVTDERAAFEEACRRASLERGQEINPQSLGRRADGSYVEPLIQCGWWGWQARAALDSQFAAGKPVPYIVGNQYRTQAGDLVRFVAVHNEGKSYETMEDESGVNRYTRRDFGRCTGSAHDYSDSRNTPPLYTTAPAAHGNEAMLWELLDESVNGGDEQQIIARAKIRHLVAMRAQGGVEVSRG